LANKRKIVNRQSNVPGKEKEKTRIASWSYLSFIGAWRLHPKTKKARKGNVGTGLNGG